jgi:tetratricopeptide (TPR) repeat protein
MRDIIVETVEEAIKEIKEAQGPLNLDLCASDVGEAGAKLLSEAIKEARVPLSVDLWNNDIGDSGAKFIAEAIKVVRVPLNLYLGGNKIGVTGTRVLAQSLKVAQVPITLDLWNNFIGDSGAKFLSEAIKVAQVPLTLDLSGNNIRDAGAKFLAYAIIETRVPLSLDLKHNSIRGVGIKFLVRSLKEARAPLKLNLNGNLQVRATGEKSICDAQNNNFIINAKVNPSEFFAKLKFNPFNLLGLRPILIQTPEVKELIGLNYPQNIAIIIQEYAPDTEYLAWQVVAAIRAIEGGSRENKYASINYDLLAAVYSTNPVAYVASALEVNEMEDDDQEARREAHGEISVEIAQYLNDKSVTYEDAGDNHKALDYKERALMMYQTLYEAAHPEVARSLNGVGVLYEKLGDVRNGLDYKEAALNMRKALYETAHPDTAGSLNNVGIAYELLGDLETGLHYKEQGLEMMRAIYPGNHPAVMACLSNVAVSYEKLGDVKNFRYYTCQANYMRQAIAAPNKEMEFKGQGTLANADNSYPEYYSNGIYQVLKLRLSELTNTVPLKSRYFGNDLGYEAWLLASDVGAILSEGKQIVLVPINLDNKHWLGLLFKGFGDSVEITYMDSEQRAMLPKLKDGLEYGFRMNSYQSHFITAKLQPQSYNNCGFELIENFVHHLSGTRATQGGAMYVHSLLVENSLLDPEIYVLKLEENTKLIKFLSNSEPIGIQEIPLLAEQVSKNKHERTVPNNSITKLKTDLHRANILFKTLDFVVDSARLVQEPSPHNFKKLVIDYAYLQAMVYGVNSYSAVITGAETLYQLHLGEYHKAFNVASNMMSAIALSAILAMATRPYLGLAYGALVTSRTAYDAVTNAYSFAMEFSSEAGTFRSAIAYKDLSEWFASSPLQYLYDFETKAKEYKLKVNDLFFDKKKTIVEAQMKAHGEFGQKVFDHIYLPQLLEKYALLNGVIRGELTKEEAQDLESKPIAISYSALGYDHCVRAEGSTRLEEAEEHYYCYTMAEQILDHVVLTGSFGLKVLESL